MQKKSAAIVLLVDDDSVHRLLIRKNLEIHGFRNQILEVENGQQAIDYIYGTEKYADRAVFPMPDLILLDIKMPVMSGFEVLEKLKNDPDKKHIPVIILTTSAHEEDIIKGYKNGANAYVTKPIDMNEFTKKLKEIGIFWMLVAETTPHES